MRPHICLVCAVVLVLVVGTALTGAHPAIAKRDTNDIAPLEEVYLFQDDDVANADSDDRGDRDKRKIGIVKLGVTNGIINFVFGKLDAFLDAKTNALIVFDDVNRAKNHAFDIDNTKSALTEFLNKYYAGKAQLAATGIVPAINTATTFFNTARAGIANAVAAKVAPLSSLSSGLVSGLSSSSGSLSAGSSGGSGPGGSSPHGDLSGGTNVIGNVISTKIGKIAQLSGPLSGPLSSSSNGVSGGSSLPADDHQQHPDLGGGFPEHDHHGFGNGVTNGAYDNIGGSKIKTTTDDTVIFDRNKVSLEVPPQIFGGGFTLITKISKIVSSLLMASAQRTATVLEVFKPLFRGIFAIKGLSPENNQL